MFSSSGLLDAADLALHNHAILQVQLLPAQWKLWVADAGGRAALLHRYVFRDLTRHIPHTQTYVRQDSALAAAAEQACWVTAPNKQTDLVCWHLLHGRPSP